MSSYNQFLCNGCGNPSENLCCQECICKRCGNELYHGFCPTCYSETGNSFTYDPNPNFVDNSPKFSYPPSQLSTNSRDFCGNDHYYGFDCSPRVPLVYEQEPCYNQNFSDNYYPQDSRSLPQQLLCCENCGGPHETFQCQPMNQNFYNSSGFDQFQPPQLPVIHHPPQETSEEVLQARENLMKAIQTFLRKFSRIPFGEIPKVLLVAWERFSKIKHAFTDKQYQQEDIQELMRKLLEDVRNISEELAEYINSPSWNRLIFYDNDEYTIIYRKPKAITPDLLTVDSLIIRDEHLSTILKKESDEFIKSSVEDLVPIPSEFEDTSDNESECDVPVCDDSSPLDVSEDKWEPDMCL
ncbi:hypothetical protein Tco_1452524 [Tanacetum coccineum]